MFFTECARLAERHPELALVIEQVDAQLKDMHADGVIRVSDLASFLRTDPNRVSAAVEKIAQEKLLRREEMVECVHCRMAVPASDYARILEDEGEYRCTSCDRLLGNGTIRAITVYRRGENWREIPNTKDAAEADLPDPSTPNAPLNTMLDEQAMYTHDRLAELFFVGKDALRKRLDRYRSTSLDGWKENEDRRPREAKYLYRLKNVKDIILDLRASSERPAK